MNSDIAIKVEDLSKVYKLYEKPEDRLIEALNPFRKSYHKDFYALKDISFEIKKGDRIGIIGKNGSGKSTLLKVITGVLTPTYGTVEVDGSISALLELGAGFNPEYTGIENIYFYGTMRGCSNEFMNSKLEEILSFADIGDFIHQKVKMYSSGMFVRLAFALAVCITPEILIVDEALSVGDIRFQQKAIRKMEELMGLSKAIIVVSHDMASIRNICDKVIWLKDGRIFKIGEPKRITQEYSDFMIHGILPEDNKKAIKTKKVTGFQRNTKLDNTEIPWERVGDMNLTGKGAILEEIAFFEKDTYSKIDIIDEVIDEVVFVAKLKLYEDVYKPLMGVGIFNQFGVPIIHFNNFTLEKELTQISKEEEIIVEYRFTLPQLRNGEYTIGIGIDDGTLENHIPIVRTNSCYVFKVSRSDIRAKQYGSIIIDSADISINNY